MLNCHLDAPFLILTHETANLILGISNLLGMLALNGASWSLLYAPNIKISSHFGNDWVTVA